MPDTDRRSVRNILYIFQFVIRYLLSSFIGWFRTCYAAVQQFWRRDSEISLAYVKNLFWPGFEHFLRSKISGSANQRPAFGLLNLRSFRVWAYRFGKGESCTNMRIVIALLVACGLSVMAWASLDRPLSAPDWTGDIRGVAYNPSSVYTNAQRLEGYSEASIDADLEQLSGITNRVRTYAVDPGLDLLPSHARTHGVKVSLGLWLGDVDALNEAQISRGIEVINNNADVIDRVFVGNEVVLRGELTAGEVATYIMRVKNAVPDHVAIGTADVWSVWIDNPELADVSDFVGVHLLPYWEGIRATESMAYIEDRFELVEQKFPDKHIVIAETGWPSEGRVKRGSVPSPAMEAYFLRHFLNLAEERNFDYYIMEAFDQPWKVAQEGAVGAFWGILDAEGEPKFNFSGPLSSFDQWRSYATVAVGLTLGLGLVVLILLPAVSVRGYLLVGCVIGLAITGALLILEATSLQYPDLGTLGGALLIVPAGIFTAMLLTTEAVEWALSLWRKKRAIAPNVELINPPRVSIHIATYNEPPLMVMQTLNALSRLNYPNFEVIVLDNNTVDESLWKPVRAHCESLGERFRFFHFDNIKGFKAGALNKALEFTDPNAEFIAVVDSDYQATENWLNTAIPAFADEKVAVVQAPQDYRDDGESWFKSLCYAEYTGFFRVGMVERNEHNAIIQHGTMCVIRRSALNGVGDWSEWCITEDTELGLRLFEAGYTAVYLPDSMGRGLMPDTYGAYKSQRYRWVYGAMQIMKRHSGQIFRGGSQLSLAQRYHFVAGWMPWIADSLALVFTVCAIVWTGLMTIAPYHFDVPLTALSSVALALFAIKTIKTVWLYRAKVGVGFLGAVAAALTGLSLAYTVGTGVLAGLVSSTKPFLRTPKCASAAPWSQAIRGVAPEVGLLGALSSAILMMVTVSGLEDPADWVWTAALAVMAIPYGASLIVALGSTFHLNRRPVLQPEPETAFQTEKLDIAA